MNRYVSTYGRDYTWSGRSHLLVNYPIYRTGACACYHPGPVANPKLYKVKENLFPQELSTDSRKRDSQADKLYEIFPYAHNPCQNVFLKKKNKNVHIDRFKTVYQTDYCHFDDHQAFGCGKLFNTYDLLIPCQPEEAANVDQTSNRAEKWPTLPKKRARAAWDKPSKEDVKKRRPLKDEEVRLNVPLPPWKSEYQDVYSRMGRMIMRDKIHHHRPKNSKV